jgi:hypothetical protein
MRPDEKGGSKDRRPSGERNGGRDLKDLWNGIGSGGSQRECCASEGELQGLGERSGVSKDHELVRLPRGGECSFFFEKSDATGEV